MKITYEVKCDYCGTPYTVKMHKAEFKRCTGAACCAKRECRDKNTAEILEKIARIEPISGKQENGQPIESVGKLPAFGILKVIWGS